MTIPLTEKYRPKVLDEVVGNHEVISCLKNIIENNKIPHMLFYGPPGTGKTTSIRALLKHIPRSSIIELNASDERGISTVRNSIKEFASTYSKTIKIVILDEVDFMSRDAQNALRRIIEDHSKTTRFCLIANYPKKIIPAILSRCTKFRFNPIEAPDERIFEICKNEEINIDEEGLKYLKQTSYGDMRKIVNDIQALHGSFGRIDKKSVLKFNGMVDEKIYKEIYNFLLTLSFEEIKYKFNVIRKSYSLDTLSILNNVSEIVKDSELKNKMVILKNLGDIEYRLNLGCNDNLQLCTLIGVFVSYRF